MSVKAIDRKTVHQICSGQVVLSLAVAVKELVENSLDAGATSVEVRLKEHGSELVEVLDNGCGVEPGSFQALTLKHHTSKLRDFSELESGVATFGFRGEALSSLCALSDLVVTTCHKSCTIGSRLHYDSSGAITSQTNTAREVGTTVALHNLFHTLPVRHKEFTRNLKKEYAKMVTMLQGYCLISTGVRISCYNQAGKSSKRQLVLSTSGNSTLKDNILNIFGTKQLQQLVELSQCPAEEAQSQEEGGVAIDTLRAFRLTGFISRCNHGYGRSAGDRQFWFFNNRPVEHSKLAKTVNEVYHAYNRHQFPFVVLNITTPRENVDVNVTPDKRQVLLHQEKALLILLKASLVKLFEPMQGQFDHSQLETVGKGSPLPPQQLLAPAATPSPLSRLSLKRSFAHSSSPESNTAPLAKQARLTDYGVVAPSPRLLALTPADTPPPPSLSDEDPLSKDHLIHTSPSPSSSSSSSSFNPFKQTVTTGSCSAQQPLGSIAGQPSKSLKLVPVSSPSATPTKQSSVVGWRGEGVRVVTDEATVEASRARMRKQVEVPLNFDLSTLASRMEVLASRSHVPRSTGCHWGAGQGEGRFRAKIAPSSNSEAEDELRKEIRKSDFKRMEIVGQFNLGFIIARLGTNLFIIDQHASDEKYRFESLQRQTTLQHQRLLQPIPLELTAAHESVLMENLSVFEMNGFHFLIQHDAPPTKRVELTAHPVSKSWSLGPADIDEMIFMLTDSCPGEVVRPSAVRAMFASRACRSAVMIGTALNHSEMRKVLVHMGEIEQPWNCPHGRPVLRHLLDLARLIS